jgi:uncharacterized coiled-coil DUF342 family protein
MRQFVVGTPEFKNRIQNEYIGIIGNFSKINQKMWELMSEFDELKKESGVDKAVLTDRQLKIAEEIRKQTELAFSMLGRPPEEKESITKLSMTIAKAVENLGDKGYIQVDASRYESEHPSESGSHNIQDAEFAVEEAQA